MKIYRFAAAGLAALISCAALAGCSGGQENGSSALPSASGTSGSDTVISAVSDSEKTPFSRSKCAVGDETLSKLAALLDNKSFAVGDTLDISGISPADGEREGFDKLISYIIKQNEDGYDEKTAVITFKKAVSFEFTFDENVITVTKKIS